MSVFLSIHSIHFKSNQTITQLGHGSDQLLFDFFLLTRQWVDPCMINVYQFNLMQLTIFIIVFVIYLIHSTNLIFVLKPAVTLQFVSHSFSDYHDPTIEDSYQQQAVIDGEAALLDILDTAGQVEFTAMRDQYMRCGEGFIICYSVTDRHSFQEASEYRRLIARVRLSEDIPLVLVANKLDLESQRRVSTQEGKNLAAQFGCPFFETSAALRHYIDEAFFTLVREIRRKESGRVSLFEMKFLSDIKIFFKFI